MEISIIVGKIHLGVSLGKVRYEEDDTEEGTGTTPLGFVAPDKGKTCTCQDGGK